MPIGDAMMGWTGFAAFSRRGSHGSMTIIRSFMCGALLQPMILELVLTTNFLHDFLIQ